MVVELFVLGCSGVVMLLHGLNFIFFRAFSYFLPYRHRPLRYDPQTAAEKAVSVIGYGYDLSADIDLSACKVLPSSLRFLEFDETTTEDLIVPGGIIVPNVSTSIKCDKGERIRFSSDVLSFTQMSEQFNRELGLYGKIPCGLLNSMFGYKGCWQTDAASAKALAFDGFFITLYSIELARSQFSLSEFVKQEVPNLWNPSKLARFIKKYGTHIVVGVKMGGKDVIHLKQLQESKLESSQVQDILKQLADDQYDKDNTDESPGKVKNLESVFWDLRRLPISSSRKASSSQDDLQNIVSINIRRGGIDTGQSHKEWLSTVSQFPDVISMSLVPITSLLSGVYGSGYLSHAINLYLRYKPGMEELETFLEFQLPRQWAPAYQDYLPVNHRKKSSPVLKFTFMGPKLYVNTIQVDTENRPVTGVRLFLEGTKSNNLAIHLQHLPTKPDFLDISDDVCCYEPTEESSSYFVPVNWSIFFSHVCTAAVEHNDSPETASIVTKAWFQVRYFGLKKVLFLRLGFSTVASATKIKDEWDEGIRYRESGILTSSKDKEENEKEKKAKGVDTNSAIYPSGQLFKTKKLSHFVDTEERTRGPEVKPGYWLMNGARLCVQNGKISIKPKYCLLSFSRRNCL